jgi:hypothetical protein
MPYPKKWNQFCQWRKLNGKQGLPEGINTSELNRFAARYRLAQNFRGLHLEGYSNETTVKAYSAVIRAFLAYTALEQLHEATMNDRAIKDKQHLSDRWKDQATEIATELRRATNILEFLHEQMESKRLQQNLKGFMENENHNCLYVATALRNAVAHGFMSVHPKGTSPQVATRFCDHLTDMLMQIADQGFSEWFESLSHEINNSVDY